MTCDKRPYPKSKRRTESTNDQKTQNLFQKSKGFSKTKERSDFDLKIVLLNVGPDKLEGLGARNLGSADEGLHLRGDSAGLHDAAELALAGGGGLLRGGGEGGRARHAQVERPSGGKRNGGKRRRFGGEEGGSGGDKPARESHGMLAVCCARREGIM